jgi:hypothetical protein
MNLCSKNHDEICYEGRDCPMCLIIDSYCSEISNLQNAIINLEDEITSLEDDLRNAQK